jgi:hypothetical protein
LLLLEKYECVLVRSRWLSNEYEFTTTRIYFAPVCVAVYSYLKVRSRININYYSGAMYYCKSSRNRNTYGIHSLGGSVTNSIMSKTYKNYNNHAVNNYPCGYLFTLFHVLAVWTCWWNDVANTNYDQMAIPIHTRSIY